MIEYDKTTLYSNSVCASRLKLFSSLKPCGYNLIHLYFGGFLLKRSENLRVNVEVK